SLRPMGAERLATRGATQPVMQGQRARLPPRVLTVAVAAVLGVLAAAAGAPAQASTGLPLVLRSASLEPRGSHLVGEAKLTNSAGTAVPQSAAYLALRASRGGELTAIAGFSVPSLPAKGSKVIRFDATITPRLS